MVMFGLGYGGVVRVKFTSEDYENAKNEEKTCDSRIMCISNAESYELKNIRVCVWGDY